MRVYKRGGYWHVVSTSGIVLAFAKELNHESIQTVLKEHWNDQLKL